jgi:murein tripeptide amidase MpaA
MSYLNVDEVEQAIKNLEMAYPTLCKLIPMPNTTFEGRSCNAIRLGGGAAGSRDVVMIICGQHAREWGSCEIGVDFAADLLEAYDTHAGLAYGGKSYSASDIQTLLDTLHVIVFPLVNPDGRHYSQTVDPIHGNGGWRRNRNPANSGGNPDCIGVDLNRNYDFLFDFPTKFSPASDVSVYTSVDPCNLSQVYHGPSPFSEPETQNVKWLLDTNPRTRWFIDVHSYSEDILYSWGDDDDQSTDPTMNFHNAAFDGARGVPGDGAYKEYIIGSDFTVGQKLALVFRDALQLVRGKSYTAKQSFNLYPTAGASDDYAYARHIVDPSKGKIYSYVIEWGTEFRPDWTEMAEIVKDVTAGLIAFCLEAPCGGGAIAISQDTPIVNFNDVPASVTTSRAAVFSVQTCSAVTLTVTTLPTVTSGPGSFSLALAPPALPAAPTNDERDMLVWVSFQGTNPGDVTTGTMTVHCMETGQDFVIPIHANTIAQPKVASVMVLDKSGSMDDPSGIPGKKRIDVLHAAAPGFPQLLPDQDGIGIVSFDTDAFPVMPVTAAGGGGIAAADAAIAAHATNPLGLTAIGDGVELAHNTLTPLAGYDSKAIVVFTDGEETASKYIADVMGLINDRVFAIGLGTVQEVNPVALSQLVNNTGGYLLLTDALGPNDTFRLAKYFVQILAGVTNADIVVDPEGSLPPGVEARIPFDLNAADYGSDAIMLSPAPWAFDFQLETPAGVRIDHHALGGVVGVKFTADPQLSFYRSTLPVVVGGTGAHQGRWHVVLKISDAGWKEYLSSIRNAPGAAPSASLGVPYSVVVHARSSLNMTAFLTQTGYEPGATFHLRAVLTEIGLPVDHRAKVNAIVKRPDGTSVTVPMAETDPGVFEAAVPAPLAGVYPVRFLAKGTTLRGFPFTREQTRTGLVWRGGNDQPPHTDPGGKNWCDVLRCLLKDPGIQRLLKEHQIDPGHLEKCVCEVVLSN